MEQLNKGVCGVGAIAMIRAFHLVPAEYTRNVAIFGVSAHDLAHQHLWLRVGKVRDVCQHGP